RQLGEVGLRMESRPSSHLSLTSLIGDNANGKMEPREIREKLVNAVESLKGLRDKIDLAEGAVEYEKRRETELENDIHKERSRIVELADDVRKARTRETEFAKNVYSWIEILREKRNELILHSTLSDSLNATLSSLLSSIDILLDGLHKKRKHVDEVISVTDRRVKASQMELSEMKEGIEAARDRREFLKKTKKLIGKQAKEDRQKCEKELSEIDRKLGMVKEEVSILTAKLPSRNGDVNENEKGRGKKEESIGMSTTTLTETTETETPIPEGRIMKKMNTIHEEQSIHFHYSDTSVELLPRPNDLPISSPSQLSIYTDECEHKSSCECTCHDDQICSCETSNCTERNTPSNVFKTLMQAMNSFGGTESDSDDSTYSTE
ncbi:hypothetical protein PRIPAC_81496, partial [Pristionchus pacificus]